MRVERRRYAGVDIGFTKESPLSLVVVELGDKPVLISHELFMPEKGVKGWEASIDNIGKQLGECFDVWGIDGYYIDLLAYELPHIHLNAQTTIKLAHMCGIVRKIAVDAGIPVRGVQPSQAKAALVGSGAATKEQMVATALMLFGVELSTHEADAVGVALAGASLAYDVA